MASETIVTLNCTDSQGTEYSLNVDISSIVLLDIPEDHEFSIDMTDDQEISETTDFVGPRPKK